MVTPLLTEWAMMYSENLFLNTQPKDVEAYEDHSKHDYKEGTGFSIIRGWKIKS
jgi:hypothetical protein